jgi:tight adherence protein B
MLIPALTFCAVLLLVIAVYWVFIVRTEDQSRAELRKRMGGSAGAPAALLERSTLLKQAGALSQVSLLNALLRSTGGASRRLERLIERSGLKLRVGTLLLATFCLGAAGYLIGRTLTHSLWGGLAAGAGSAPWLFLFVTHRAQRRLRRFEELFPEAVDLLARALRAGHAFTTGLAMVAEEMADPVGPEFRLVYDRQNFGMPLADALKIFAERVGLLDARFFVTAVLTQREAGGNLSEVLENLGSVMRERFKVKRQVRVITAHARITGFVLVCLPPATAVVMVIITPDHIKILVEDPLGIRMIVVGILLQIAGTLVIRRLVDVEY